jgi:hypothetical protein
VPEETYRVLLVMSSGRVIDGFFVYRGELPEPNQLITVTDELSPVSHRARVTRVLPDDEFPVRATQVEH